MAIEIERKFLVSGSGWKSLIECSKTFEQAYLSLNDHCVVRIRVSDRNKCILGIKQSKIGMSRAEYEYEIPLADGREMINTLAIGSPIIKHRHMVTYEGYRWEIDEFQGVNRGLVVAEIELENESDFFSIPPWLGREVTAESRYYNASLALYPYQQWQDG